MRSVVTTFTCDRCGEKLREPEVTKWASNAEPPDHRMALLIGGNTQIPFDLCTPCLRDAWKFLDGARTATIRKEVRDFDPDKLEAFKAAT